MPNSGVKSLNTVISDSVSTENGVSGRDLVYKKQGVCVDRWWEPNICINHVSIVRPLLVSYVGSRELGLATLVSGCHNGLLLWPCGHSELNEVVAPSVLLWRGGLSSSRC